ncbi:MAG: hypothetical protein U9R17_07300 [Thermodesulfobacteriota bacterium]|nr:hypothetical protein [Thermodesulfobacteriota bacterium]
MMKPHKRILIIAIFILLTSTICSVESSYLRTEPVNHEQIDCSKLMDKISSLNQQKRFSMGIWETFIYYASKSRLAKKRKAYNKAYSQILDEYNILPANISETLDKIWTDVVKKVTVKYQYIMWIYGPIAMTSEAWYLYKVRAFEYAKKLCRQSLDQ